MTTLSTNGRVMIPRSVRRVLGLRVGTRFVCSVRDGGVFLKPNAKGPAAVKIGRSKHSGLPALIVPAGTPKLTSAAVRAMLADFP